MVSVKDFRLECFCFLLSFISKIIHPCSTVQFRWSLTPKFLAGLFLNASAISYLNWWVCSELSSCFSACGLGSFGSDLYLFMQ